MSGCEILVMSPSLNAKYSGSYSYKDWIRIKLETVFFVISASSQTLNASQCCRHNYIFNLFVDGFFFPTPTVVPCM